MFSNNFTIGLDDGVLASKGLLDREAIESKLKGVIELKVIAIDMGKPPQNSSAKVVINVGVRIFHLFDLHMKPLHLSSLSYNDFPLMCL